MKKREYLSDGTRITLLILAVVGALLFIIIGSGLLDGQSTHDHSDGPATVCYPDKTKDNPTPCRCPAMVADAQDEYAEHCRKNSKSREEEKACLAEMPDHCDMTDMTQYDHLWGEHDERKCGTFCKPGKCKCFVDQPCHNGKDEKGGDNDGTDQE